MDTSVFVRRFLFWMAFKIEKIINMCTQIILETIPLISSFNSKKGAAYDYLFVWKACSLII